MMCGIVLPSLHSVHGDLTERTNLADVSKARSQEQTLCAGILRRSFARDRSSRTLLQTRDDVPHGIFPILF